MLFKPFSHGSAYLGMAIKAQEFLTVLMEQVTHISPARAPLNSWIPVQVKNFLDYKI